MARECKRTRDERRFGKAERLADKIIANPRSVGALKHLVSHGFDPVDQIGLCTLVEAQNVFDYVMSIYEGKKVNWQKDIPVWKPPFDWMFLEFSSGGRRHGVMIASSDPIEDGSSLITTWLFMEAIHGVVVGPVGVSYVEVKGDGSITELPTTYSPMELPQDMQVHFDGVTKLCHLTAFMAISFMHCKNVTVDPVNPPKEINRERKKHGLRPFVRYHTINIEPMKKVLRTEGRVETEGLKRALHICRGHFSHYSEEKPLFGKVAGTFWIPAHVRGSAREGVVVSDYNVKPVVPNLNPDPKGP